METERARLQRRCRELRRLLPPGTKCTAKTEVLRQLVADAELVANRSIVSAPVRVPRSPIRPTVELPVSLSNDLLDIIATYTIPTATYLLITFTGDLAVRLAYSQRDFWRRKVIVERQGVVFNDAVVDAYGGNYHTYYRLVNRREYGTAAVLWSDGTLSEPIATDATSIRASDSLFVRKETFAPGKVIYDVGVRSRLVAPNGRVIIGVSGTTKEIVQEHTSQRYLVLDDSGTLVTANDRVKLTGVDTGDVLEVAGGWPYQFIKRDGTNGNDRQGSEPLDYYVSDLASISARTYFTRDGTYCESSYEPHPLTAGVIGYRSERPALGVTLDGRVYWSRDPVPYVAPVPAFRAWLASKVVNVLGVDGRVYQFGWDTHRVLGPRDLPPIKLADVWNYVAVIY